MDEENARQEQQFKAAQSQDLAVSRMNAAIAMAAPYAQPNAPDMPKSVTDALKGLSGPPTIGGSKPPSEPPDPTAPGARSYYFDIASADMPDDEKATLRSAIVAGDHTIVRDILFARGVDSGTINSLLQSMKPLGSGPLSPPEPYSQPVAPSVEHPTGRKPIKLKPGRIEDRPGRGGRTYIAPRFG